MTRGDEETSGFVPLLDCDGFTVVHILSNLIKLYILNNFTQ